MSTMPARAPVVVLAVLVAAGCSDQKVSVYNTPPAASILSPVDGDIITEGELVELVGVVKDSQDDEEDLEISWSSNVDGVLGTDAPDVEGSVYLAVADLTAGSQVVTLTVADTDGESDSTAVSFTIGDDGTIDDEGSPTVMLVGPSDGEEIIENTTVSVVAVVTDAEQDSDTLDARLLSSEDGTLWTGNPDSDGTVSVDWDSLSLGLHTLSLSAEDAEGNIGVDMVSVLIVENASPTVYISYPLTGSMHWTTDSVLFEAEVADDLLDPGELSLSWESDVDGTLSTTAADSDGFSTITAELTEDAHVITLWVEDDQGNLGSDSIVVDVVDPLNYDDDGDGVTENEGDCDDEDDTVSPDEEEVCDDMDNDCDDEVNEDDMDAYESNDSVASAYSLGEVDGMLWASETITVSGLTFHNEDDIDGFYWDAEEDWFENVEVDVTVTGLPSAGDYVLELYLDSSLQDSDSGSGTLTVDYEGSIWDDGESDFTVLIYPASAGWPSASCDVTYDVEIISHNDSLL